MSRCDSPNGYHVYAGKFSANPKDCESVCIDCGAFASETGMDPWHKLELKAPFKSIPKTCESTIQINYEAVGQCCLIAGHVGDHLWYMPSGFSIDEPLRSIAWPR